MHNGSNYQVSVPFIRDAGLDMTAIRALGELCAYSAVEAGKEVFAQACMCHVYDNMYMLHVMLYIHVHVQP